MIANENKFLIFQRLFIYMAIYIGLSLILDNLLLKSYLNKVYTSMFILLLVVDIVLHIIYIIKDYSLFKLFIVIQNILIKIMYIVVALAVVYTIYNSDNVLSQIFISIVILGMFTYPIFIILFLIDTYKGIEVSINKSILLVLTNGVIVYLLGFFINTEYTDNGYDIGILNSFDFHYGMGLIYIPIVISMIVYIISLSKVEQD